MKKFFEEPTVECVRITSEVITDEENRVPDAVMSTVPNPFDPIT